MSTVNYDNPDLTQAGLDIGGGEIYHYEGIPLTGILQFSYPDGNAETEITYVNGYPEGAWREYFPNGQLAEESYIKHNIHDGRFRLWDENGNLSVHLKRFATRELAFKNYRTSSRTCFGIPNARSTPYKPVSTV